MNISELSAQAEAFLFAEGGSLSLKRLSQLLECTSGELNSSLDELASRLDQGIALVRTETEAALVVSQKARDSVQKAYERELGREIGDAGLEVLAILLYRGASAGQSPLGGATRAQIDYVRGVNSSSTLRSLLSRGLVERTGNPDDAREYLYRPTVELLAHLGITQARELPEYATIASELAAFEETQKAGEPFGHDGGKSDPE